MKMNSVCTAVGLVLLATGCVSQKADPNLVFHCTFDDVQSILSPAAGLPGKVDGAKFVDGKFGKALYVPAYAAAAEFPFPNGLPSECGTIEFWAKLEGGKPTFTSSGDPYLFAFVDDKTSDIVFETHFNANNGCGKSGIIFGMPGKDGDASFVGGNSYACILGEKTAFGWHHYVIAWSTADATSSIALYVDGEKAGESRKPVEWRKRFSSKASCPLRLVFSNPKKDSTIGQSPYAIDNFKVLCTAVLP